MAIEGRIRARVYRRGKTNTGGYTDTLIAEFDCISARGASRLNRIGEGECKAPTEHVKAAGVAVGDIITVVQDTNWYPVYTPVPFRIACFIVTNMKADAGHVTTLSGGDMLGELADWPAITPVGAATEYAVDIAAGNLGKRTFLLRNAYAAGIKEIVIYNASEDRVLEGDDIHIALANGDTLFTGIAEVVSSSSSAGTVTVRLDDALPSVSKTPGVGGVYVYLLTPRIRVTADMSDTFSVGERVRARTSDRTAGGQHVVFETRIDGFEETELDDATQYWVRLESPPIQPIPAADPLNTAAANQLTSTVYDVPTTTDVADLLKNDTFGVWSVGKRDDDCTIGTTYEPTTESVFDALQAILDTSGYAVKVIKNYTDSTKPDRRQLRVLNPSGGKLTSGTVPGVSCERNATTALDGYAVALQEPSLDIEGEPITHIIPMGAGGGQSRFDLTAADLSILDEYNNKLANYEYQLGRRGQYWVLYRARKSGSTAPLLRDVWRTVTFAHIRPVDEDSTANVRAAANQMLRAAADYLHESYQQNISIDVTVHTLGDPQPGDLLPVYRNNMTPNATVTLYNLLISEVEHAADASGIRKTRLLLTSNRLPPETGELMTARKIQQFERYMSQTNAPTAGGASFGGNRLVFPGSAVIGAATGGMSLRSQTSNVEISAPGQCYINTGGVRANTDIVATGTVEAGDGLVLIDETGSGWTHTTTMIDGVPRLVASRTTKRGGPQQDELDDPGFDDSWVGTLY
jgi:hypothetical protein